ncbi:MAG: hypothetical protein KDA25_04190 [Phycisphaerales bacterium]|nr:hypothetical protein [Phycisphaerales bacterium]
MNRRLLASATLTAVALLGAGGCASDQSTAVVAAPYPYTGGNHIHLLDQPTDTSGLVCLGWGSPIGAEMYARIQDDAMWQDVRYVSAPID